MSTADTQDYKDVALQFTKALVRRDYAGAYSMTSGEYQKRMTQNKMRDAFEAIVPTSWKTVGPVEVGQTMESWPGKQTTDVGWVNVSIGGDMYSEAVRVVITSESGMLKIRDVEYGRP